MKMPLRATEEPLAGFESNSLRHRCKALLNKFPFQYCASKPDLPVECQNSDFSPRNGYSH